jgi:hypothetical protein
VGGLTPNNAFELTVTGHCWRAASVQRYFTLAARCDGQRAAAQRGSYTA